MLQVSLLDEGKSIFVNVTPYLKESPRWSSGEHGMERCDLSMKVSFTAAAHFFALAGSPDLHIAKKGKAFRGRVEDIAIDETGIALVGYGLWSILDDEQTYTALWSTTGFDGWEELTEENLSDVTDAYKVENRDRLYISPNKGKAYVSGAQGGLYFMVPDGGLRNANVVMFAYEWVAGPNWTFRLRSFNAAFGSANSFFSDTPSSYATKTGAKFYTYTAAATLAFDVYSNYFVAKTLGTAINEVSTTLAPSSLQVNTTSNTNFLAGTRTVTPASMTNIVNGIKLLFGSNVTTLEKVTVSNVTGTTFDATFKNGHNIGEAIKSIDDWAVSEVDTTITAGFNAGAGVVVTPASMANIVASMSLIVGWGGEAEETISVTSITATTFTATFVYAHPTSEKIKNGLNTYTVRPNSMTGIIAGMNLDIGGRNSETVYVTGVTATTFTAAFRYGHPGNAGVSTSKTQLVTPSASITGIVKGYYLQIGNNGGVTNSAEEIVEVLSVTGSSFIANFNTPHASTDTVKRVFRADADVYLKITDLRVATSTVNMIDTTIGSSITAGNRTVTPAAMTGIYVGQKLYIAAAGNNGEIVTVTAITGSTFTAVFALSHTATVTVKGIAIYADEVVNQLIGIVSADNSQLSSSTALVESPELDLTDLLYEDQSAMDVINDLVGRGDNQTPPRTWSAGVWDNVLHFWPRGTDRKTWYLDASTLKLSRSLQSVVTEVVAAHKDTNGRLKRTSAAADEATSEAWTMNRKVVIDVHSTHSGYAEIVRDTLLEAKSGFIPAAEITFRNIFTDTGALANPEDVRADDNVVIRNMPTPLPSVDFRIRRVEYGPGGLRLELEGMPDSIETLVSMAGRPPAVNGARRPFVLGPMRRLSTIK